MRTLYLDCGMGAAGDMLTAALLELLPDQENFLRELNALDIPGVTVTREQVSKCGIGGTHITVRVHGEEESEDMHAHSHNDHPHSHAHPHDSHEQEHSHHHDHDHPHDAHEHDPHHAHVHEHPHGAEHTHHHHSGLHDIAHIVGHLALPEKVKKDVLAVYGLIAEAESRAHGVPVTEIHFHEVGTMDAVADVTAVCMPTGTV